MEKDEIFMGKAIELSALAVEHGNEPFGAVLVRDGEIVYTNENQIHSAADPTFHAEAGLIRRFCRETHITDLSDYTLYSSCEPCFMCSGAMGKTGQTCLRRQQCGFRQYSSRRRLHLQRNGICPFSMETEGDSWSIKK